MSEAHDPSAELLAGIQNAGRFFMGEAPVQRALARIAALLDAEGIPWALAGAMALNEHGYRRVTVDVDLLLTAEGLVRLKAAALGRGWLEKFPGSKGLRDVQENVVIDVLIAGQFPGDGKPKAVAFPDPARAAVRRGPYSVLPLERLLELKLASGLSAPHRLKDLADVLEVIRARALPRELASGLDPSVRAKFDELWLAAQAVDPEDEGSGSSG